jgi:hypothetical protein
MGVAACLDMCCPKKEATHPPDPSPPKPKNIIHCIIWVLIARDLVTSVYGIRERARERERERGGMEGERESERARDRERCGRRGGGAKERENLSYQKNSTLNLSKPLYTSKN